MNNTYQLFLKLKNQEKGLFVSQLLQEIGYQLKRRGSGNPNLSHYQNLYLFDPSFFNQYEIHIKIPSKELNIDTVAIRLNFGCTLTCLNNLFDRLTKLQQLVSFHLMDVELCSKHFIKFIQSEKRDETFQGLSKADQLRLEQKSYIPINFLDFQTNYFEITKRKEFFPNVNEAGERAPDDRDDVPKPKSHIS